jgi:hypothetical protein
MKQAEATKLVAGTHSGLEPTYFKLWMPYLYHRVEHPKRAHVFLPLNRNYKPLGSLTRNYVRYEDFVETHGVAFARDPASFKGIWTNVQGTHLWLYDDSAKSRVDYFERLERLFLKNPIMLGARLV